MLLPLTEKQEKEVIAIRRHLIQHIQKADFNLKSKSKYNTTYSELVSECNLPYKNLQRNPQHRKALGNVLAHLLKEEHDAKRPMLTSIIYGKGLYRPRNGFYKTMQNFKIDGAHKKQLEKLYKDIKKRRKYETDAVIFWKDKQNIKKYSYLLE